MTSSTPARSTQAPSLWIVFHVRVDSHHTRDSQYLSRLLSERFDDVEKVLDEESEREIVFRIGRPVFEIASYMDEYLSKLLEVFTLTDGFTPHFTHFSSEVNGK